MGAKNVLGGELESCCAYPVTGFYRDGFCNRGPGDFGMHVICARMTREFLVFSKARGNDLMTPTLGFPGLKPGDRWCVCAMRWKEALDVGAAPPVILEATRVPALEYVGLRDLKAHALRE